jgi:hypothetical protein
MEKLVELYLNRTPIKQILKECGINKTQFYKILHGLDITRTNKESAQGRVLSQEHKDSIRKGLQGKYTGWHTRQLNDGHDRITNELAYIVGVLYGDGYIIKAGGVGLETVDEEFAEEFGRCLKVQFGLSLNKYYNKKKPLKDWRNGKIYQRNNTYVVRMLSVNLRDFLTKIQTFEFIDKLNRDQKVLFLRGLWDSEGSVYSSGSVNGVSFTHKTKELCDVYADLVNELCGFRPKIRQNMYSYEIFKAYFYKKEYIRKFYYTVNPIIYRKRVKFESIL